MNINRRAFLRKGLMGASAAAVAAATGDLAVRALGKDSESATPAPVPDSTEKSCCAPTPALTTDGKLVMVQQDAKGLAHPLPILNNKAVREGIPGRKFVMVIDLAKCDGCKHCTVACQKMHYTPSDREWIKVFRMQEGPHTAPYWMPKPCFHCDNPPCTRVCPVDATFKRQDGIVLIDNERCIGCRFCMAACPYSTRYFNWDRPHPSTAELAEPYSPEHGYPRRVGTVEKCDFCPEMAAAGKLPDCAGTCPMGAIYFGDQNEDAVTNSQGETERLSTLLVDRAGYRYMEELGTEPRLYYLPPKNRKFPVPGSEGDKKS